MDIKLNDLHKHELEWLDTAIQGEYLKGIPEKRVVFTDINKKYNTYIMLTRKPKKRTPSRLLKNSLVLKDINGQKTGFYFALELLYWYINNREDIWGYRNLMNILFREVIYGEKQDYDYENKGYKVLNVHLREITKGWRSLKKSLFIGYMYYIGLFQESSTKSMFEINRKLKNKQLKCIGLTIASKEPFGKVTHYSVLQLCWNCGDEIEDVRSGLCDDCLDYWDKKTK